MHLESKVHLNPIEQWSLCLDQIHWIEPLWDSFLKISYTQLSFKKPARNPNWQIIMQEAKWSNYCETLQAFRSQQLGPGPVCEMGGHSDIWQRQQRHKDNKKWRTKNGIWSSYRLWSEDLTIRFQIYGISYGLSHRVHIP